MSEWWKVLGVPLSATDDEIKNAYRRAALVCHPDRPGGSEAAMKRVNAAYEEAQHRHLATRVQRRPRPPPRQPPAAPRAAAPPRPRPSVRVVAPPPGARSAGVQDIRADVIGGLGVTVGLRVDEHGKIRMHIGMTAKKPATAQPVDGDDELEQTIASWLV